VCRPDKELLFELVLKNLYILTTNIAGLAIETDSTVDELRNNHLKLMRNVSSDILKLQSALTGKTFAEDALSLPVVQVFFMGQKFIEEVRGFSLIALEQKIKKIYSKMSI
jgi:hypothetical protein